jgi:hypothetical protein
MSYPFPKTRLQSRHRGGPRKSLWPAFEAAVLDGRIPTDTPMTSAALLAPILTDQQTHTPRIRETIQDDLAIHSKRVRIRPAGPRAFIAIIRP